MFIILFVATATLDGLPPYRTVLNCFHLLWLYLLYPLLGWLCHLPSWFYSIAFMYSLTCIIFNLYYYCITVLPLPTLCPFPLYGIIYIYIYIYIKQNDFALDERSLGSATTFVFGLCVLQIRLVVFSLIYALRKFVFGFGLLVWVTNKYLLEYIDQQGKFLFVLVATLNLCICEGELFWCIWDLGYVRVYLHHLCILPIC